MQVITIPNNNQWDYRLLSQFQRTTNEITDYSDLSIIRR